VSAEPSGGPAATLLTAAPALAVDGGPKQPCSCCSDGSAHEVDHGLREEAMQKKASTDRAAASTQEEDPFIRNHSFGG
jgi:hypothetical protein